MRKLCIVIGISLFFFIGMVAQASARPTDCWDLDGDTECDINIGGPDNEDLNEDGKCNQRDCPKDEPTAGPTAKPLGVYGFYNGSEHLLGYLGNLEEENGSTRSIEVFDPVLMRFYEINMHVPPYGRAAARFDKMWFSDPNCLGQEYLGYGEPRKFHFFGVMLYLKDVTYWIVDTGIAPAMLERDLESREDDTGCINIDNNNDIPLFPAVQIDPPWWVDTILEYPIEIRPIE